ncbi:MAG: alpha-ketoglutarate decarboxylase [Flavobacteriaceae bacterium]
MTRILTLKYLIFTFFVGFYSIILNAQETKSDFWNKVSFGGGVAVGFGNDYTNIAVSPSGIYQFNDQIALGVGLSGNYSSRKDYFEATVFGGGILGLFNPIEELQLSVEFEQNNVNLKDKIFNQTSNYWYPALHLGGGYAIGNFGAIGMRYDVLYNERKSVYGSALSPFIRVFF